MQLSRFNSDGINEFQTLLQRMREGVAIESPLRIITNNTLVEHVESDREITIKQFETRLDMAAYLNPILAKASIQDETGDAGLWAWLSAVFIDSVCPADGNGMRAPGKDYRHIPSNNWNEFYRHLIRGPLRIYRLFEVNLESSAIVLCQHPSKPGDFVEQLGSRQERITNPAIISAANTLYYDINTKKPRRGAAPNWRKSGTLRRYTDLLDQLDLTYDLYSMNEGDILNILPDEFTQYQISD